MAGAMSSCAAAGVVRWLDGFFWGLEMREARMPTTLPSPVDRAEFRFVAVDATGAVRRWVDEDVVWVRDAGGPSSEAGDSATPATLH